MASQTTGAVPDLAPRDRTILFRDFVEVLIPGGDLWPSAAEIGVHGLLIYRFMERGEERELRKTVIGLVEAGGPLDNRPPDQKASIVARFQTAEPELFARLYEAVCLAYYESPFVADLIRAQGRPYSPKPHLTGYPLQPFQKTKDTPAHGRGHYLATAAVKPVDVASLNLDASRTERWGLER